MVAVLLYTLLRLELFFDHSPADRLWQPGLLGWRAGPVRLLALIAFRLETTALPAMVYLPLTSMASRRLR